MHYIRSSTTLIRVMGAFLASALTVLLCFACGPNWNGSKLEELEHLQTTLPVFSSMAEISVHKTSKGTLAGISKLYKSEAPYDEVKQFYMSELKQRGWAYVSERPIHDWGKDFGGRELIFHNNDYQFSIQYAGENANYGWDYAIDIGWGK